MRQKEIASEFLCVGPNRNALTERRAEQTVVRLIELGHWIGWLTLAGGCLVIASYALELQLIRRPISEGAATHPLTAALFVICGLAIVAMRAMRTPLPAVVVLLGAGLVGLVRVADAVFGIDLLAFVTPFSATVAHEGSSMAVNTAAMFVLIAASFLLRHLRCLKTSQIVAAAGMSAPLISLTGYIYGIDVFHGAMSLTTAVVGVPISSAPLLLSARTGFVRALASPWDGGRFARLQILTIGLLVFLGGLLLTRREPLTGGGLLPVFVVITILTVSTTIAYCSIIIEHNDYLRRRAERIISRLVLHDPLTGLYNRRFLAEHSEQIVAFAKRHQYPICVLMLDFDHFKRINDRYGHPAGDTVLRRVAATLQTRLRRSDLVVRYGGEEFLILLNADLEGAVKVGEEIRSAVKALDLSDLKLSSITVSIGVASLQTSLSEAISEADARLYWAKQLGRNRVLGRTPRLTSKVTNFSEKQQSRQENSTTLLGAVPD
jgi:diguanylate cyclase (GGDEF)-like protein